MRKFNVTVNGKVYNVEVVEEGGTVVSAPVAQAAAPAPTAAKPVVAAGGNAILSPMPGVVLKLLAADGAMVKKNDKILVLEAMKMENEIVASADGKLTYLVKQGDAVESGAQLASIN